jgi:hypothetical protein
VLRIGEYSLCSNYKNINILTKDRPPEADTLHSLYPLSVVLTHNKLSHTTSTAVLRQSNRNWGPLLHLRGGYLTYLESSEYDNE